MMLHFLPREMRNTRRGVTYWMVVEIYLEMEELEVKR